MRIRFDIGILLRSFCQLLALACCFVFQPLAASQSYSLVYSSGNPDIDKLVQQKLTDVGKTTAPDFSVFQASVLKTLNELSSASAPAGATFAINVVNYLGQQPRWLYQTKVPLVRECLRVVFVSATNITVEAELAALKSIEGDEEFTVPLSPLSDDGGGQRKLRADWWLHAWTRYAAEINSPDLVSPGPGIDLPKFSAESLKEPQDPESVARRRLERQELIRQRDALHLRSIEFPEVKSDAERSLVAAYAKPPFAFAELTQLLTKSFGDRHPSTGKILRSVAAELPPEKRIELDRIIAGLPPAATIEEIRTERRIARERGVVATASAMNGGQVPASAYRGTGPSKVLGEIREASQRNASVLPNESAGRQERTISASTPLLLALVVGAGALLLSILWRAQARAHPGRSK